MLLFQKSFWDGLKDGSISLTFRAWPRSRVKPGGRYRCHPIGVLEVDAVDKVSVAAITEAEAHLAGFPSREELLLYMSRDGEPLAPQAEVFRVRLHYGGDGDRVAGALDAALTADDVDALRASLAKLDERSPIGPWTTKTLALIARKPQIAAGRLAEELGRDKAEFKADVVKLKKLGLTQSFEVGYELSPRGRAYIEATARAPKRPHRSVRAKGQRSSG